MAVIQGDPSQPDKLFTVRLRLPAGHVVPAHSHPTDENVTVICGRFGVGMGDVFRKKDLTVLRRGGFVTAPAGRHHFAGHQPHRRPGARYRPVPGHLRQPEGGPSTLTRR